MIIKHDGDTHFAKDYGALGSSRRIVLPSVDGCRVKVTEFTGNAGERAEGIEYAVDETVFVFSGHIELEFRSPDGPTQLGAGDVYHVPAGTEHDLTVLQDCKLRCVYSAVGDKVPDDE